ncbi:MAG TPA: deaminase [Dehalococcoidia bacterium]|jgi:dCMP deaminase|nr:deaminase [Dehalococcoidia bacterium]
MLRRINREELLVNIVELVSRRSTCQRLAVGAILVRDGRILSSGYNGAPRGLPHCNHHVSETEPCTRTVHAEANAIAFAAKTGVETDGAELYCTHSPCNDCAKLMINAGISRFVYVIPYRDEEPLALLRSAGIGVTGWIGP